MSNKGKKVSVNYRGTLDDGTQFDSSYDRGQTLDFVCGAGQMIAGFDKAVEDMQPGEKKTVRLEPAEAYGEHDEGLVFTMRRENIQGMERIAVGDQVGLRSPDNQLIPARVVRVTPSKVVVDANHELAGQPLTFEIELVSVED